MENQDDKSLNPQEEQNPNLSTDNQQDDPKTPETKPDKKAKKADKADTAPADSEETRIATALKTVRELNPDLTLDEALTVVERMFKKPAQVESKPAQAASTVIKPVENTFKDRVYLKKDVDRKFPIERSALSGVIVRQTYKKVTEEGDKITVPARNINEFAIYSQADFDRLNNGDKNKPGFTREGIHVEVWHKPGDTDTLAE